MNTQTFLHCLFLGLSCSIFAVTVIVVMAKERILNWWFRIGERYGKRYASGQESERWFYKPIWGCEKCFAGQLAAWSFLVINFRDYNIFLHLVTVCIAILSSVIISHYINHIIQQTDDN